VAYNSYDAVVASMLAFSTSRKKIKRIKFVRGMRELDLREKLENCLMMQIQA